MTSPINLLWHRSSFTGFPEALQQSSHHYATLPAQPFVRLAHPHIPYICADTLIARRTLITTSPRFTEGDLGNPQSTSSEQSSVKTSRATGDQPSLDTASVQEPVSIESAIPGTNDEGTPTEEEVKRDPNEPAEKKRKHVEKQGDKPLGPEDHQ